MSKSATACALRILHVIDSGGLYGAEAVLLELADEQRKAGHSPIIASIAAPGGMEKPLDRAARGRDLQVRSVRMLPGPNPAGALRLLRLARRERADDFHTHGYKGDILLGFLPRRVRRVPLVSTVHGYTHTRGLNRKALYTWLDRLALARIDRVVLVHRGMASTPGLSRLENPRWRVIENGIPPLPPPDAAPPLDDRIVTFCRRRVTLGCVGRLAREKALPDLIALARDLVAEGLDVQLAILGEGPERPALEKLVADSGLAGRVLLPGFVERARDYLPLFRVFVLPSLTEGLPITLLEAMQAGVPIVATRVGGVPGVLQEGRGGIVVEPSDPEALRDGVRTLIQDPDLASRLAQSSRAEAATRYSIGKMAERYLDLYREVVSE